MTLNYTARIVIALVVGLAAGFVNFLYLNGQKEQAPQMVSYLCYNKDVRTGETVDKNAVAYVPLPLEYAQYYQNTFVSADDFQLVDGLTATRPCLQNTLVQRTDFASANDAPEYRILGPFRLVAIGSQFTRGANESARTDAEETRSSGGGSGLTVAVKYESAADKSKLDRKARRLLQLINADRNSQPDLKIVAVVAYPQSRLNGAAAQNAASSDGASLAARLQDDETAIFVPTPNVALESELIMTNNAPAIGFVVPAAAFPSDELETYAAGGK